MKDEDFSVFWMTLSHVSMLGSQRMLPHPIVCNAGVLWLLANNSQQSYIFFKVKDNFYIIL